MCTNPSNSLVVDDRNVCEVSMINPLIGMPQGAEWFIILAIVILVFGAAKLPDLARSTGQALKIFKSETKGLIDDDKDGKDKGGKKDKDGGTAVTVAGELPPGTAEQSAQPAPNATVAEPVEATDASTTPTERHPG